MNVFLRTYGCRANHYDSEAVRTLLTDAGHHIVSSAAEAEVAVFNSCAVTAEAEADVRQGIRRAARENPGVRSVVMGCAAALDRGTIRGLPAVTDVIPGADLDALAIALGVARTAGAPLTRLQSSARATLRIQDGCDEHCTFCATTIARGAARSRTVTELVQEARALAERHPEIVLTGVHIGSWGCDLGSSLGELVERLVDACPGTRFRLSSLEATEIDARLEALFLAGDPRLAPSLHAPLQSGSDRVLRRMGRHWYTAAEYERVVTSLAARIAPFGLGADVIAGFPGEREADHRATADMLERLPFTYLHVFPYSARPGTAATRLPDALPPHEVQARAKELREIGERKAAAYRARRAGAVADVVVSRGGATPEGITEDFLTVRLTQPVPRGTRVQARLSWDGHVLLATPMGARVASGDYLSAS